MFIKSTGGYRTLDRFHFFLVVLKVPVRVRRDELWHYQEGQVGKPRKSPKFLRELSTKIGAILLFINHRKGKQAVSLHVYSVF